MTRYSSQTEWSPALSSPSISNRETERKLHTDCPYLPSKSPAKTKIQPHPHKERPWKGTGLE
jgi:hypothetical protein